MTYLEAQRPGSWRSWDLVITYNWGYNPAYNWGNPTPISPFRRKGYKPSYKYLVGPMGLQVAGDFLGSGQPELMAA